MKFNKYIRKIKILIRGFVSSLIFKLLYRKGFDPTKTLIICGSTRSGSTWLAELVSSIDGHSQIFEPMHTGYLKEAKKAGIKKNMYVQGNDAWLNGQKFFTRVLSGKVINPWTTSQIPWKKLIKTERLVVKFVRANLILDWLSKHLDVLPPAMVIRHPCAIIMSQLDKGWAPSKEVLLSNKYFDKFPEIKQACNQFDKREERAALAWCMRYHAPLTLTKPYPFILVCYENLVRNGEEEIKKLFDAWHLPLTKNVLDQLSKPSDTVTETSQVVSGKDPLAGWRNKLTEAEVDNILAVLNVFGMDFYSHDLEPNYEKLNEFSININNS